jgi:hypothetical protein
MLNPITILRCRRMAKYKDEKIVVNNKQSDIRSTDPAMKQKPRVTDD